VSGSARRRHGHGHGLLQSRRNPGRQFSGVGAFIRAHRRAVTAAVPLLRLMQQAQGRARYSLVRPTLRPANPN
jgi:hypothetical protein